MSDPQRWAERLHDLESHGTDGVRAAQNARLWIDGNLPFVRSDDVVRFVEAAPTDLVIDSFRKAITFGTGGQRGPVGIGPNRINLHTAAKTVVGHAEFLTKKSASPGRVVVANDTRIFTDIAGAYGFMSDAWELRGMSSRSLAAFACAIYRAYGITPILIDPASADPYDAYMATPELSYAIRQLAAAGGLNVSASHNHPDDNGLKVFNPAGGQYCPPDDGLLADTVLAAQPTPALEQEVQRQAPAEPVPADVHTRYIDMYASANNVATSRADRAAVPVVYSPMGGTGLATVAEVLRAAGFRVETPPGHGPDGTFAAIPMRSPNPEIPGVAQPSTDYADTIDATLVLSTDPDADRLGVEVKADGVWRHLTGNQIGAIALYYITADPDGPRTHGEIVTTIATSRVLRAISDLVAGNNIQDELLIGFKFIGQYLDDHLTGRDFMFAAEESHGYLTSADLRDKDAASIAALIAGLHLREVGRGRDLWQYLMSIYDRVGVYSELGRSLVFPGVEGANKIAEMMRSLRADPPTEVGGEPVVTVGDYLSDAYGEIRTDGERAARNLLVIATDHYRVVVRPSGTEAKLKYYFDYREQPGSVPAATRYADVDAIHREACDAFYGEVAIRAGYKLSRAAIALPDVLPVDEKLRQADGIA
jgi:phosphoglucomutase/phosphomannomutase